MKKFYLTTPIYYVNDTPHLGHAYTTVAADVLARYHRLFGEEVFFLTGTDEHGSKVEQSAKKAGRQPADFCAENAAEYSRVWDRLNISNDFFIRTTSELHRRGAEKFLLKLKEAGAVYQDEYYGRYCVGCEKFITEKELVDGKCPDHQKEPEWLKEKNYFFKLKDYLPKVKELIESGKLVILPETEKKEVLGLIRQGLEDFSISRENVAWGMPLPFDDRQTVYVWVEALANYISALGYGSNKENFFKFWPPDIQLMAKDIVKFHALYWPAMLLAAGLEPPKIIFAHGFFTVDGHKMSKSLGNAVNPDALIDDFGAEAIRYLILSQFPFGQDGDIKVTNFVFQYNSDLANGIGNLVSRILAMVAKYNQAKIPEEKDFKFSDELAGISKQYHQAMTEARIDQVIGLIKKMNAFTDGYIERQRPWELAKEKDSERRRELNQTLYNLLELVRQLALMIYPILPETAEKIFDSLGEADWKNYPRKEIVQWGGLTPGQEIKKGLVLFPRIEKK